MIEVTDLIKSFNGRRVLNGVSVSVQPGETLSIIGGSGSGKSTFSKCVVKLIPCDGGTIKVDGKDITHIDNEFELAHIRKNFGYMFQEGALFDSLSVWENVVFGLKYLTKIPPSKYRAIAKDKLALVGLKDVEDLRPSELSGGMKKRVSLARAIAAEPDYIIYDEPTSGLDPIMSDIINDLIIDLKRQLKVASIVITHDMKSAYKISDKIAFLHNGLFVMTAPPDEYRKTDNPFVRQFVDGSSQGPIKMKLKELD